MSKWSEALHPRGPGGKFKSKGTRVLNKTRTSRANTYKKFADRRQKINVETQREYRRDGIQKSNIDRKLDASFAKSQKKLRARASNLNKKVAGTYKKPAKKSSKK